MEGRSWLYRADCCASLLRSQHSRYYLSGAHPPALRWRSASLSTSTTTAAPPRQRRATVVFHTIINCTDPAGRGGHYRVYKDATLTTTADDQPRKIKTMSIPTNYELCKEYQRQ
jgi:hypothetical protein